MTAAIIFERATGAVRQVTTWDATDRAPVFDPPPELAVIQVDDKTYARIDIPAFVAAVIASQPGSF